MALQRSWVRRIVIGISVILAIWLMVLLISGGWLSDAPGYPSSVIGAAAWLVLVRVSWSISRLRTATGYQHIPRIIDVIAGLVLAVGLVFNSINLIAQSSAQPSPIPSPFWLLLVAIILGVVANLIESGWGKTNVPAWLRVIGAAVIGATLLLGFLMAWTVFYR